MIVTAHGSVVIVAAILFVVILAISRRPNPVGALLIVTPLHIAAHIAAHIALT